MGHNVRLKNVGLHKLRWQRNINYYCIVSPPDIFKKIILTGRALVHVSLMSIVLVH